MSVTTVVTIVIVSAAPEPVGSIDRRHERADERDRLHDHLRREVQDHRDEQQRAEGAPEEPVGEPP